MKFMGKREIHETQPAGCLAEKNVLHPAGYCSGGDIILLVTTGASLTSIVHLREELSQIFFHALLKLFPAI